MKRLTAFLLITTLIFQGFIALAQIDEAKMERDLRVASGVLTSLMNTDNDHLFGGAEPEGNYLEGFGVIFTIEDNMVFKYNYKMQYAEARAAKKEAQHAIREAQRAQREVERELSDCDCDDEKTKIKVKNRVFVAPMPPIPDVEMIIGVSEEEMATLKEKSEAANAEFEKKLKKAFETFLVDYSQLIGQLKPTDKILLTTKSSSSYNFIYSLDDYSSESIEKSRLSAEMLVADHKAFSTGKLSREKLIAKIKYIENAEMERKADLDLFASMLKTTYNSKYTDTYFMSSIPRYEVLTGLGVVYSVKVYSSYDDGGLFKMPTINKTGMSEEERNKAVEEMYPQFVEDFKENIIRYGSTIKSLKYSDKLIIKVKMTKCETCTFPSTVEFMVDQSVLSQFSTGGLTLAQAKAKVKLK